MPPVLLRIRAIPKLTSPSLVRFSSTNAGPLIRTTNIAAPNSGHIRLLELNRPDARNAISKGLLASLRAELEDIKAQYGPAGEEKSDVMTAHGGELGPTRALVIASAVDSCFCSGADLKERKSFTQQEYDP